MAEPVKPNRLFPLRELTPKLADALRRGKVRLCRTMHECCLCDRPIEFGQHYFDAGIKLRAHWEHLEAGHSPECGCAEG